MLGRVRSWQALLAACAVLAVPMGAWPGTAPAAYAYLLGLTLVAVSVVTAALTMKAELRRLWGPWLAGIGCALTGAIISQAAPLLTDSEVPADVALLFWIAFYFPMPVAVLRMIENRALSRSERGAIAKDVAVVTAGAALFAWDGLIRPAIAGAPTLDWWNLLVTLAFPFGDVLILALAVAVLLMPGRRSGSERLMVAGLGVMLLNDIVIAAAPTTVAGINSWSTAVYLVIHATLAAAVLHPDRDAITQQTRRDVAPGLRGWRMTMLGTALCGVGLASIYLPQTDSDRAPAAAAVVVMVAVILSRLHRAIVDLGRAERTLRHQATHDHLTGLANRARLGDEIKRRWPEVPTLFFVDLDGFKAVNDTRGHHCGDAVLKAVAERLTAVVRDGDVVARLGGDEFVAVCGGLNEADVPAIAARLERELTRPVDVDGKPITVGASIGILTLPPDAVLGDRADDALISDLLRAADAAMYEAKRDGGGIRTVGYSLPV